MRWEDARTEATHTQKKPRAAPDHVRGGAGVLLYAGKVISPAANGRQQMVP